MNLKQLLRVIHQYDAELEQHLLGGEARRAEARDGPAPDVYAQQQHARWMCQEVLRFHPSHRIGEPPPDPKEIRAAFEKAMRWLGFIQGVLWSTGVKTIDEMREDNRG
jgi:hypothetical protein